MTANEDVRVLLSARAGAYRIFQNLFGNEPTAQTLAQLGSPATHQVLELFALQEGSYQETLAAFRAVLDEGLQDADVFLRRLTTGFTRLFIGPGGAEASPWESLRQAQDDALFSPLTLEVRKAYVRAGFIPQSYPRVADDHIALELDFMAQVAQKLAEAHDGEDTERAQELLAVSKGFLFDHLLIWTPLLAAKISEAEHAYFYREVAALLVAYLQLDLETLTELEAEL